MKMPIKARGRALGVAAAAVPVLVAFALASCQQILGIESERHVPVDTPDSAGGTPEASTPDTGAPHPADAAEEPAGPWDCVGDPNQTFPAGAMTNVHLITTNSLMPILTAQTVDGGSALDPVQYTPLVGEQVRACPELYDGKCMGGTPYVTSDEGGVAPFTLPNSFAGYYQFNDPSLFTTAFYPSQMLAGDKEVTMAATLLPLTATQELGAILNGITLSYDTDGGLGHVLLSIYDCHDHSAPGVVFIPSATAPQNSQYPTLIFYTEGSGVGSELPTTSATATDNSGTGGLLNVPKGVFTVTAKLASNGQKLGLINMLVQPGVASSGILRVRTH
jgi:hypothetical protein